MDYFFTILSGVAIGLIVAAPIGPVNLICIRRTLAFGPVNGFVSGLGAALGDGAFAIVTAFGLTAVAQFIEGFYLILQIVGGALLLFFGWKTYMTEPKAKSTRDDRLMHEGEESSLAHAIVSTFALTITNPATLFGFAALFAGLGGLAGDVGSFVQASVVVCGVLAGSTLWWFTITTIVGRFHAKIDTQVMRIINHASGVAVTAFGIAVIGHVVMKVVQMT